MKALCSNKTVVEAVLRSMQEEGRVSQLKGFEQVTCCIVASGAGLHAILCLHVAWQLWLGCHLRLLSSRSWCVRCSGGLSHAHGRCLGSGTAAPMLWLHS